MPYDFSTWDRNCEVEQATPLAPSSITGSPPPWLNGSFILNGPGKMKFGEHEFNHVFDGASILQKFQFQDGGPAYSSRFLKTNAYHMNTESQQIVVSEFGTKGCASENKGLLQKLGKKFSFEDMFSDNAALNIAEFGGELYANTEAPFLHKIDAKSLDTMGKIDLHKEIGITSQCPHPIKLEDGSSLTIVNNVGPTGPRYDVMVFPPVPNAGKATVFAKPTKIASVDARWKLNPCHVHSFGLSENYIVLPEQPLTIDVRAIVTNTVKDRPIIDGMEWMDNKQVKIHLVARNGGKEIKTRYKSKDPFFFLHVINSFEQDGHVIVDFCTFKKPDIIHLLYVKKIREMDVDGWKTLDTGAILRYVLPININDKASPDENQVKLPGAKATAMKQKDGVVQLTPEVISNTCYENPVINPKLRTKNYNYLWGLSGDLSESAGKVGKLDVRSGDVKLWSKEGLYACVLSFIPRPGSEAEDDGVVIVSCLQGGPAKTKAILVVLDAASMSELCVATFDTPSDASRALHGHFIQ